MAVFRLFDDTDDNLLEDYLFRSLEGWQQNDFDESIGAHTVHFKWTPRCMVCYQSPVPHSHEDCTMLKTINRKRGFTSWCPLVFDPGWNDPSGNQKVVVSIEDWLRDLDARMARIEAKIKELKGKDKTKSSSLLDIPEMQPLTKKASKWSRTEMQASTSEAMVEDAPPDEPPPKKAKKGKK